MSEETHEQVQAQPEQTKGRGRPSKVTKVRNATRGPMVVGTQRPDAGETVELTKADQDNEKTMKKVRYALKTGTLVEA